MATFISTGDNSIVILTGIAAMVTGAISMGLGEYISSKSEYNYVKNEIKREEAEIELFPEEEKEEVADIFRKMGFDGKILEECVNVITSNKEIWLNFLIKSELGLELPESPLIGALLTFISFIVGSFIPQVPYFFPMGYISLIISSAISFFALFLIGVFKTRITSESKIKGGIEMLIIGFIGFIASYGIGSLFESLL